MSEQQTHLFPPSAIKEFLTPITPEHEAYILAQLAQSRSIYDILFSEQQEVLAPPDPVAFLNTTGIFPIPGVISQTVSLKNGDAKVVRGPDRTVVAGDVIVPAGQSIHIPQTVIAEDITLQLSLLVNNANQNRLLLVEQEVSFQVGPVPSTTIDLVNAIVNAHIGPGLDFDPGDGSVTATTNGTYSVSVFASQPVFIQPL